MRNCRYCNEKFSDKDRLYSHIRSNDDCSSKHYGSKKYSHCNIDDVETHYDIDNIKISDDEIAEYILSPFSNNLLSIPLMYNNSVETLKSYGINNTYQLFGEIIKIKKDEYTGQQLCDKIYKYLIDCGIKSSCCTDIVKCIVEKINVMMPEFCDTI